MQQYTVYLYLQTALHVSDGTSTHHHELISLYLQISGITETVTATCCERYVFLYGKVKLTLTRWRSWLGHCATSRKFTVSIPDGVTGIFH